MYNNIYTTSIKKEFTNTINRVCFVDKEIEQYKRSMNYILLYNTLNDELKIMIEKKKYFNKHLQKDVKYIMNDYINNRIKHLNRLIINC